MMQNRGTWFATCGLLSLVVATGATTAKPIPPGFVYLRDVAPDIVQDIRYAGPDNFTGASVPGYNAEECILRWPAAEALRKIQEELRQRSGSLRRARRTRPSAFTQGSIEDRCMRWAMLLQAP